MRNVLKYIKIKKLNIIMKVKESLMRTLSVNVKNEEHIKIFKFMAEISKNIYNTVMYNYSIYNRYKEDIFEEIINLKYKEPDKIHNFIYDKMKYFYKLHSKKNSLISKNISYIYKKIIKYLKGGNVTNTNYNSLISKCLVKLKYKVEHTNKYEFEFIIKYIINNMYFKNFTQTKNEIKNKIPVVINNPEFISHVAKGIPLFDFNKSSKLDLGKIKIHSDQNLVTRFIYKSKLGENKNKLPSDLIINIINKAFTNYSSYFAKKRKGQYCHAPKYLKDGNIFILPYFKRSFKIIDDNVRLTVGKYVAENFNEITGNNYICLNKKETTAYKKYCKFEYLKKIKNNEKINKKDNFITDNLYISKKDPNIIDSYYVNVIQPPKLDNIKYVEITSKYNGNFFNINYIFEIEPKIEKNKVIENNIISIDTGINNLLSIYDPNGRQKIICGRWLVSMNKNYFYELDNIKREMSKNPKNTSLKYLYYKTEKKRQNKINDYFNKIVKVLFNLYPDKEKIIVGYNLNWKQNVNLGKNTNRKFYGIPYRKLINKLQDKFGKKLILTEESYTSKVDSLALESIRKHKKYKGGRIYRGLFSSSKKVLINADINGAINIMRKVVPLTCIKGLYLCNPQKIKFAKLLSLLSCVKV